MNIDIDITKPALVEPGTRYFLKETLYQCAKYKKEYYNNLINIVIFVSFILAITLFLYFKYKGKPTPMQKMLNERKKKHYILSRIKNYQDTRRMQSQGNITGLANWNNEYDKL